MFSTFLSLFFPTLSLRGTEGVLITPEERKKLTEMPLRFEAAALTVRGMPSLHRLVACTAYAKSPLLREAMYRFKYRGVRGMHHELGEVLADCCAIVSAPPETVLCPIPLHWSREFSRGFNQSALLAQCLSQRMGWDMQMLLKRTRSTGHQVKRSSSERRTALRNAFSLKAIATLPSCVMLIDDICTTGTTLEECAAVLRKAGVQRVDALVLALG